MMSRKGWICLLVLCAAIFVFRAGTASHTPITWDEPVYLNASRAYVTWMTRAVFLWSSGDFVTPFTAENINSYWQRHLPSPPLAKTINGLCGAVLTPVFGELAALRSGSALLYAALFGFMIVHLRGLMPNHSGFLSAAGVSVAALLINPRLFSHAGTANLDTIGMVFTYLSLFCFWKTSERPGWQATVLCGVLWGCAFAAKNTAILAVPIFLLWMLLWARRKHLLIRFLLMQPIAALVFFLAWPWLWHDTAAHLGEFFRWSGFSGILENMTAEAADDTKLDRVFGATYSGLLIDETRQFPWYYSFSVIAVVLPVPTLILFLVASILFLLRERGNQELAFCVLGAWIPLVVTIVTPVYDMERFLLLAMPFLSLLCGYAVFRWIGHLRWKVVIVPAVILSFVPAIWEWKKVYPYEFSFFNAAAGRLPGAVAKGFARSYWLQAHHGALPFVNSHLPAGAALASEEAGLLLKYQEYGMLRADVDPCIIGNAKSAQRCDYLLRREPVKDEVRETLDVVYTFELQGVPLVSLLRITDDYVELRRQRDVEQRRQKREEQGVVPQKPLKDPKARRKVQRRAPPASGAD